MTTAKFTIRFVVLALMLVLAVAPVYAQVVTGTIAGTVTDESGAVIPGAKIVAVDLSSTIQYTAVSGGNGSYEIPDLPFGLFKVTVTAPKFNTVVFNEVKVDASKTSLANPKMSLAKGSTVIEVTEQQSDVDTTSAEVKNTIDRRQLLDLPLPTRNPLDLVNTMAGMTHILNGASSGTADTYVNGLRPSATNITQDGINVADNFVKTSSFFAITSPTVEGTGEFNVSTNAQGNDSGYGAVQVNLTTARGGKDYHGGVFWYNRTSYLAADSFFSRAAGTVTPFLLQNRVGYQISGPIWIPHIYDGRKKTFFFNSLELYRQPISNPVTSTVMTASALTGNVTYAASCGSASAAILVCPAGVTNGQLVTTNLLTMSGVPYSAVDAASIAFYTKYVPAPNTDAGCSGDTLNIRCFRYNLAGVSNQNRYVARLDHYFTQNESIEADYNQSNFFTGQDFLNANVSPFPTSPGGGQASKRQVFSWALHSVINNNMTNEVRAGIQRAPVTFVLFSDFTQSNGVELSYPGVLTNPEETFSNIPQGRATVVWSIADNFSWVKHGHNFRMGGDFRSITARSYVQAFSPPFLQLGTNGSNPTGITQQSLPGGASSSSAATANTIYEAITGMFSTVTEGFNYTSPTSGFVPGADEIFQPKQNFYSAYFQDSFKLKSNFTFNYGVRWEIQGPFSDRSGLITTPTGGLTGLFGSAGVGNYTSPVAGTTVTDTTLTPLAGNLYRTQYNNFGPFLGFAWDPFKNGKTSVRGGFGIHYIEDGFTALNTAITGQTGYYQNLQNPTPIAQYAIGTQPGVAAPANLVFPTSMLALFNSGTLASANFFDPNLRVPYVEEWSLGVQREIGKKVTVEARYVGNHSALLYRAVNINQLNYMTNPYTCPAAAAGCTGTESGAAVSNILTEFLAAQNNFNICNANVAACEAAATNPAHKVCFNNNGLAGQVNVPILSAMFGSPNCNPANATGTAPGQFFFNSTFESNLSTNSLYTLFNGLRTSTNATIKANRNAYFSPNFFVPNEALNAANYVGNGSWSTYHALELIVQRRFSSGLSFQANYTMSKVLTDARAASNQTEAQTYQNILTPSLDKYRAAFDITHNVNINLLYQLPFGKGQRFFGNSGTVMNMIVGGWNIQGITHLASGAPYQILSGSATAGINQSEPIVLQNMTAAQFAAQLGVFKTPNGVFFINPASGLINITGHSFGGASSAVMCTAGQTTPCFAVPAPGAYGNTSFNEWNGPGYFDQDISMIKRIPLPRMREGTNFEIRFEAFNAFNHTNFVSPTATTVTSTTFGQLQQTADPIRGGGEPGRIVQFALRFNF